MIGPKPPISMISQHAGKLPFGAPVYNTEAQEIEIYDARPATIPGRVYTCNGKDITEEWREVQLARSCLLPGALFPLIWIQHEIQVNGIWENGYIGEPATWRAQHDSNQDENRSSQEQWHKRTSISCQGRYNNPEQDQRLEAQYIIPREPDTESASTPSAYGIGFHTAVQWPAPSS